jgi:hypothetical protein
MIKTASPVILHKPERHPMKYAVFKREVLTYGVNTPTIVYTALESPNHPGKPILIEARNAPDAANKAGDTLKALGLKTHTIEGSPSKLMSEFPKYFVGKLSEDLADMYGTERLLYQIEHFTPVPK